MRPAQRAAMLKQRSKPQANLTLVYGPPCAGKTTYIADRAGPHDAVIDYDLIAVEMGSSTTHGHGDLHDAVLAELGRRLDASRQSPHAWLVKCKPTRTDLKRATSVVLLDPGKQTCLDRARDQRPASWIALIEDWYEGR